MRIENRQGVEIDLYIDAGCLGHFDRVTEQAESGNIRTGTGAVAVDTLRCLAVRLDHGLEGALNPSSFGFLLHVGRE